MCLYIQLTVGNPLIDLVRISKQDIVMETQNQNIELQKNKGSLENSKQEQGTFLNRNSEKFARWIIEFENAIKKINAGLL